MRCVAAHLNANSLGTPRRILHSLKPFITATNAQKSWTPGRSSRARSQLETESGGTTLSTSCAEGTSSSSSIPDSSCAGLHPKQVQQLHAYLDYMLEVNKSMNLTAVTEKAEAWDRHVVDSLVLLPVLDKHIQGSMSKRCSSNGKKGARSGKPSKTVEKKGKASSAMHIPSVSAADFTIGAPQSGSNMAEEDADQENVSDAMETIRIIDVGTGAGLPGMVIAAARPEWKVTLLDSLRKRCDFLQRAVEVAGLTNVDIVWCRAEEGGRHPELREEYDIAIARAVADSAVLAELCLPMVRVGGLWVAPKGPNPQEEVARAAKAIKALGGKQVALEMVDSHSQDGQRTALVVSKAYNTPHKYPRSPGTPGKNPIL